MAIDSAQGTLELDHGAIPSLKWPPMKMGFAVADKSELARLKVGDTVEFELRGKPDPGGTYVIEKIAGRKSGGKP